MKCRNSFRNRSATSCEGLELVTDDPIYVIVMRKVTRIRVIIAFSE